MKRTLSFVLALVMLIGLVPMQAFAADMLENAEDAETLRQLAKETSFPLGNISGNIAILGDSTISGYPKYFALSTYFSVADGYTITDISKAGDTIVGQLNKWKALSATDKSALNYVFVQIGLNDTDETVETFRTQYTSLITQIRADAPNAMIILGTMVPCKQRWKVLYPNTWEEYQERWEIANEDIQNGYYDCDSVAYLHTEALGLDGNLRKEYNHGDHIHENAEGAKVIAYSWYLAALGYSHRYSSIVTAPTCTEQGYTTYTCACGDSYVGDYVDVLGHISVTNYNYFGKTIVCIGDSITNGVGASSVENKYINILGQLSGATIINCGYNGYRLCTGGNIPSLINTLNATKIAGADAVTIMLGVNDWFGAIKDGYNNSQKLEYEDGRSYYALGELDSDDTTTIYGAVKMWCKKIIELKETSDFANTNFYMTTPVIPCNINPSGTNVQGYTFEEMCNAIVETCRMYGIPCVDMYHNSGITVNNRGGCYVDSVHPNDVGHELIAQAFHNALTNDLMQTSKHPTCIENGLTEGEYCFICGEVLVNQEVISAQGHVYENGICSVCGQTKPTLPGDLNLDGSIDTTDVVLLRRYIAGGYGVNIHEAAADVNADGVLNTSDVVLLRRYIAGGYGVELASGRIGN